MAYFAAFLGGCLYALGNIGFGYWPLAFICLVPLWWALDHARATRSSALPTGKVLALGAAFGVGIFATGYQWLLALSGDFVAGNTLVSYVLWSGCALWFATGFALYSFALVWSARRGIPFIFAASLPLLLLEWWQVNLFPTYLGSGLVHQTYLAQLASLGGPLLLSSLPLFVNVLLYRSIKAPAYQGDPVRPILLATGLVALGLSYGGLLWHKAETPEQSQSVRVGMIQSNLVKLDKPELSQRSHKIHLEMSRALLKTEAQQGKLPDLLIWPETAYVRALRRPLPLDAQFIREEITVPLLFGATSAWQKEGKRASANSLFLANRNGRIEHAYDKNLLVPFAETIPFEDTFAWMKSHQWLGDVARGLEETYLSAFEQLFPQHQSFSQGFSHGALSLGALRLSTPICFELVDPSHMLDMIRAHDSNLIVTIANDAWFGDSQEPWIHLALARQRAIEHGKWVVRATNSGISAIINPYGQITQQTGLHTRETLVGTVWTRERKTFYTLYGDWLGYLSLVLLLTLLLQQKAKQLTTTKNQQVRPSN